VREHPPGLTLLLFRIRQQSCHLHANGSKKRHCCGVSIVRKKMLHYERAVEVKRRPWQRHIEVYSPKIKRRLTLFSWDAHDAWLLLEAGPSVQAFCEWPAYVESVAGRLLNFWVEQGGRPKLWTLSSTDPGSLHCRSRTTT